MIQGASFPECHTCQPFVVDVPIGFMACAASLFTFTYVLCMYVFFFFYSLPFIVNA